MAEAAGSSPVFEAGSVFDFSPTDTSATSPQAEPKLAEPIQQCTTAPPPEQETVRVRVSLFFDGTFNNRTNA